MLLMVILNSASLSNADEQQTIPENSLFYQILVKNMTISSNGSAFEITIDATGTVYLIKNATEVRTGASVTYKALSINSKSNFTEISTGVYSIPISEKIIIAPGSAALESRNFKYVTKEVAFLINGSKRYFFQNNSPNITLEDYIWSYSAPQSISFTGAINNPDVSTTEIEGYSIPVELILKQEILYNGAPLSGTSLTVLMPEHNLKQAVVTDSDSIAEIRINDSVTLTISNGSIVTLGSPLKLPEDSDLTAFWSSGGGGCWCGGGGGGGGGPTPTPAKENRNLQISVNTDRMSYSNGEIVHIYGTVTDEKGSVDAATVSLSIKTGGLLPSTVYSGSRTTVSDGSYSFDYQVTSTDGSGYYYIDATASKPDTSDIDYYDGSATSSYQVVAQPKITDITFDGYLAQYKAGNTIDRIWLGKGDNAVYNMGNPVYVNVWLDSGGVDKSRHSIAIKTFPSTAVEFNGWISSPTLWGLSAVEGVRFKVDVPPGSQAGRYRIEARLLYNSGSTNIDLGQMAGGSRAADFFVIFSPDTRLDPVGRESYVYSESSNRDEIAVYFQAYEETLNGQWAGKEEALARDIRPFCDLKLRTAVEAIQGEMTVQNAVVKIKDKVRSQLGSGSSLDYAAMMTELSRSAGIPARIATMDANEGKTGRSWLQVTEVYIDGEWQIVDAMNNEGPMTRQTLGNVATYSGENNDEVLAAGKDWNNDEVGDWW